MADVVNLNRFRKARAKAEKAQRARENRTRHGRTKAEKHRDAQERAAYERGIDLHEREQDDDADDDPGTSPDDTNE